MKELLEKLKSFFTEGLEKVQDGEIETAVEKFEKTAEIIQKLEETEVVEKTQIQEEVKKYVSLSI